ncbi:zinc finger BED domain-containing protein DAYSLEEPER isoform X1 [Colossoma macropomum]|uniref:zinc finger BED domain-containing protein DAYSLEEPER isoform X1 n=1 Tax=Colossoma macropomum TaxID=42526 RepID=UPI0018652E12|nr:zinc finger BED domain-containing protein DAYSLEEPER isoform X1 [Colossoma macropomum]
MDACSVAMGRKGKVGFYAWRFRRHFTIQEERGNNLYVQCNLCLPTKNVLSTPKTSCSNLKKHLDRKHQEMYDEFLRKKDVKREAYASGTVQTYAPMRDASRTATQSGSGTGKFDRSDPRQSLISETIAKMIIRDLQPVQIVENEGFRELLQLLEPRYVPEPSHYIQQQLLPAYAYQVQVATKLALSGAESCSVTLDLWRSNAVSLNAGSGYMGVTCHFITTDWQIKSALLACLPLPSQTDTQRMLNDFDEISHANGISGKVFRIVLDPSPYESRSAFRLPGFYLHGNGDVDDEEEEDSSDEETGPGVGKEDVSGAEEDNSVNQFLARCRIDCFARSLGQCVREGIRSSPHLSITLTKAACFYNYIIATVTAEKLAQVFSPGNGQGPSASDRHWNTQLKTMRQMLESVDFLEDIVDRNDLALNSVEKAMLRELVEVLEPFEEATDMVKGDKHVSISLALPSVLGLRKHLAEIVTHQCTGIVTGLSQALDRRLAGILEDPLYVTATTLDPQFKLSWSSDRDWHKQVLLEEVGKHTQAVSPPEPSLDTQPSPSKRSRLFSFIKQRPTTQAKSMEQELSAYLLEEPTDEDPLQYWKRKSIDFPLLSQVAKKVFTVPATATTVERIFSLVGKTLRPERCRPLPKNLETLIYLKANYSILWS